MENISEFVQLKVEIDDAYSTINFIKNEPPENKDIWNTFPKEEVVSNFDLNSNNTEYPERIERKQFPYRRKPFKCEYGKCQKGFEGKKQLSLHMQEHLNSRLKCEDVNCNKSFRTRAKLSNHMRLHSNAKQYKCTYEGCSKSFLANKNMQDHLRSHFGIKIFTCTLGGCSQTFKKERACIRHRRWHSIKYPFKCQQNGCFEAYKSEDVLQRHMRTQHPTKPYLYSCQDCNAAFTTKRRMENHLRKIHHDNKPLKSNVEDISTLSEDTTKLDAAQLQSKSKKKKKGIRRKTRSSVKDKEKLVINPGGKQCDTKNRTTSEVNKDEINILESINKKLKEDDNSDRMFLLSLLPDLNAVNDDFKLDLKKEMLLLLQKYKERI